jgi:uncharacterized repeat protein (TIGR03803 family)
MINQDVRIVVTGNSRTKSRFGQWSKLFVLVLCYSIAGAQDSLEFDVLDEFERPGRQPLGALVLHSDGFLYGTTVAGGTRDLGTVFRVSDSGTRVTLHAFSGPDGAAPVAGLVEGSDGTLFGTTAEGGAVGFGTVFKVTPAGEIAKLVDFTGSSGSAPGSVPGPITVLASGILYGATAAGGSGGFGTVYTLTSSGTLTSLAHFTGETGERPGAEPQGELLSRGASLYGTTRFGGSNGQGTVFSVSLSGEFSSIAAFSGGDGSRPAGGLVSHSDGLLYGTTEFGGASGVGVVFGIDPDNPSDFSVLHHFTDPTGSQPVGTLEVDLGGSLLGTASVGGQDGWGSVFRLTTGGEYNSLLSFSGTDGLFAGAASRCGLTSGDGGVFFGVASAGGPGQRGVIFRIDGSDVFSVVADFSPMRGWAPSGAPVRERGGNLVFPMAEGGAGGRGVLSSVSTDEGVVPVQSFEIEIGGRPDGPFLPLDAGLLATTTLGGAVDHGTIVLLDPPESPTTVASLNTTAGEGIRGPLVENEPNRFYGVSLAGGLSGNGTVFRVSLNGVVERLFSFSGTGGIHPGSRPQAPLVRGSDGSLYGVTERGGQADQGVVFKLSTDQTFSILSEFQSSAPRQPRGGLCLTGDGRIFGTTSLGGAADAGTVFELDPNTGILTERAFFTGATGNHPGTSPVGPLIVGSSGTLYGMTAGGPGESGTAYAFAPTEGLRSLVAFSGVTGAYPGITRSVPEAQVEWIGGLNEGPDGLVYGVTPAGGEFGGGVAFRLSPSSSIDAWKISFFGDSLAPDLDDPDSDGLSNILEYALQRSPVTPDPDAIGVEVYPFDQGSRLGLALTRDPSRSDVDLSVESSSSPSGPWTTVASSISGAPFSGAGPVDEQLAESGIRLVRVLDRLPLNPGGRRFMRVVATR